MKIADSIRQECDEFSLGLVQEALDKMEAEGVQIIEPQGELDRQIREAVAGIHEIFLKDNPAAKPIYEGLTNPN